jgi:putative transposase
MPWKETNMLEERMKFIVRYLGGEKIASLCEEFGISRKTGHKIINRYQEEGVEGLRDRLSVARHNSKTTPLETQKIILDLKKKYPSWGAPKIVELFKRQHSDMKAPVISTVHAILDRHGLVRSRNSKGRYRAVGTVLKPARAPNDLWCIDYKGQFLLGNKQYCYPLTITDHFSRYLLSCEGVSGTKREEAFSVFEHTFKEHGLPLGIRSDNGVPFSSRSVFGLSRLSVWWLRLGILLERTQPGCPQQNGRHERMHKTLKLEVLKQKKANFLQQQEAFDEFIEQYNHVRPHEALGMKTPGEIYRKSSRSYPKTLPEVKYPDADKVKNVSHCGSILFSATQRVFLSESFGGQPVGLYLQEDGIWLIKFMDYKIGFFDESNLLFTPAENPFINPYQILLPRRSV